MKNTPRLSILSRALLFVSAVCLIVSVFVPIWKIDLDAPQYPEGLRLLIYSNKLGGNVDIINGLNHYIGMKTLHAEEFIEFTVLPYIIGGFALLSLVVALAGRRSPLYFLFTLFALFGVIAMYDFWRWEYNYGHDLDPNAAIIVPGMAYQPPLIGFKQLLNFGAYSVPALGGWLFISSGLLMLFCIVYEKKFRKLPAAASLLLLVPLISGCSGDAPESIRYNTDNCDYCRMTIVDDRFAAVLFTAKGRTYKFDDLSCLINYIKENGNGEGNRQFVCDYLGNGDLLDVKKATFIKGERLASPMGGNVAAFGSTDSAGSYATKLEAQPIDWASLKP